MPGIWITGGGLYNNNGAQAMTFVTVDEMRKRYPGCTIRHQSGSDRKAAQEAGHEYTFELIDEFSKPVLYTLAGVPFSMMAAVKGGAGKVQLKAAKKTLEGLDTLIDVSGFAFGTSWGIEKSLRFLMNVRIAKKFGMKVYLMPQSFGPVDFPGFKGRVLNHFAKRILPQADKIFAREQAGFDALTNVYGLTNVEHSVDMVLQNKGVDPAAVYRVMPEIKQPPIDGPRPVGVFPNKQLFKRGDKTALMALYQKLIGHLVELGHTVYVMYHAGDDRGICAEIKGMFGDESRVVMVDEAYSSIEYEGIMKRFEFLVASRYHSIVHGFKQGTPCVGLGWAEKYGELMGAFGQGGYVFDARNGVDEDHVMTALDRMHQSHQQERARIEDALKLAQKGNVFEQMFTS